MERTVALTGATGFIGSLLRQRLIQSGVRLRALCRHPFVTREDGIEWVQGALEDPHALARLVDGADAVIHCAAVVRGGTVDYFQRNNVTGSMNVLRAAQASGCCERFLFMSSLAARYPHLSWYAASKHEAERQLLQAANDMTLTIFRPTAVYGPGDREMRPLFEWLLRGWLFVIGQPEARLTFLQVEDLVCAVVKWLEASVVESACYELNDGCGNGYGWADIATMAAEVRQGPVRQVNLPPVMLNGLARANLALSRLTGQAPMLTPSKVGELRHPDWSCSNEAIRQALAWEPAIRLRHALQERCF
ncbi:nucleoside-diphosphate-sugar epimerase [Pseudomonas duriflava]|uniref:Nucleoside-diphosphate-sugar epimerase n=1 Tax=Pseudomonas duriflava TaxID=459528 RepID=A0A562QJ15_9PSED|nr:NAD-dependent epimerase/dehydratase family protein [Pseudomonas duriflava]TWI56729.1 nucleoside-diphosphate-sugar epimerase [Pseudomonas duriflava]